MNTSSYSKAVKENLEKSRTESANIPKLEIPLHPPRIASVPCHWIQDLPTEGLPKPLVLFTVEDRNMRANGNKCTLKKLYDKRKNVAIAFLLFSDEHGVQAYDRSFWPLHGRYCSDAALAKQIIHIRGVQEETQAPGISS